MRGHHNVGTCGCGGQRYASEWRPSDDRLTKGSVIGTHLLHRYLTLFVR